jgi:hypothetical protein
MGNLDIGEARGHLDLDQKDFTTRSGGVSGNIHQGCIIITEAAEENNDIGNLVVDIQGNKPRSNSGKEKEKIYVSTEEGRIIMSAINPRELIEHALNVDPKARPINQPLRWFDEPKRKQ